MRNLALIGSAIVILVLSGIVYSRYEAEVIQPTPSPTTIPEPSETPTPSPAPITYQEIGPDESVRVQCGEGRTGTRVVFARGSFAGNIGLDGQTEITASVKDTSGEPAGGLVEWKLYYWGKLRIDGCKATFIAPDAIGTAYSVSASINTRVVSETPPPSPSLGTGEGGPIFAGFSSTTKVTILSGTKPTCYDPAGVAISINSVPTTSDVQIRVDTPKFLGRVYNGRNATVRDGAGTYDIQIFVNGALYGKTASNVANCQLPTVKF